MVRIAYMKKISIRHRIAIATAVAVLTLGTVTACSTVAEVPATTATTSSATPSASSSSTEVVTSSESPDLATLVSEVTDKFTQATYTDSATGAEISYNIYLPADYDSSKTYPVVLYIADSSLVGQDVTAPLSQYGALIWASDEQQAVQESIVVVPEYPEVIIDDHGSYTTTDYVEATVGLLDSIKAQYSVDENRVYGTGQSMGAMTVMYLAAQYPDLFAAELIVSGQWDPSQLARLTSENFLYFAAAGDENASGGQTDVEALLDAAGVSYGTTTLDATAAASDQNAVISELVANGATANFATFDAGTVLAVAGTTSSSAMGGSSEHMASFEPAYKIAAARDWLLSQTA
jgi:predicted peptidase